MSKIIVITGTSAAGKSTLAKMISKDYGFPLIRISSFSESIAKEKGFTDLDKFESAVGLKKSYFDILPDLLSHIKTMSSMHKGVIIEGVYNPELYEKIKQVCSGRTSLFLLGETRHVRKRRLQLRESLDSSSAKRGLNIRRFNKKMKGLNAMLTHPDAIPLNHLNVNDQVLKIKQVLSGNNIDKGNVLRRIKKHLEQKKLAQKRLEASRLGLVQYKSARKK